MNRLALVAETLRAALNDLAAAAPAWLRGVAPAAWYERYAHRIEDYRLPEAAAKRDAYGRMVGADGYALLAALDAPGAPPEAGALPVVAGLRDVQARHFEHPDKPPGERPPGRGAGGAESRAAAWTGYMVHLSETCDEGDGPHLVTHVDTAHEATRVATRTDAIHAALAARALAPGQHLVDVAYASAALRSKAARPTALTSSARRAST